MVARSGEIFLHGVYLLLYYVCPNDIDTSRQNDDMIWIVLYLMCRYNRKEQKKSRFNYFPNK